MPGQPVPLIVALSAPPKSLWYLTRGSGAVSLLLLTASTVLGIVTTIGASRPALPRFVVQALHRNISLLVTVFIAIHVATSVADSYVPLGVVDAFVPLHAGYRPVWTGLGAVAVDLLLALLVTSLLRVRVGLRVWRTVHWTAYACWPIALVHALGTGSDTRSRWMVGLDVACVAVVMGSVWWRLAVRRPGHRRVLVGAAVASVLVPVLIGAWAVAGPGRPGWGHSEVAAAATTTSALDALTPGATDSFRGTVARTPARSDGTTSLRLDAPLDSDPTLHLTVQLAGRTGTGTGGLTVQSGVVTIADDAGATLAGALTSFAAGRLGATLTASDGRAVAVVVTVRFDAGATTAQGSLTVARAAS